MPLRHACFVGWSLLLGCGRSELASARLDDTAVDSGSGAGDAVLEDGPGFEVGAEARGHEVLALGIQHACALDGARVRCWGYNGNGQLADGTTVDRLTPVQVPGLDRVREVAAGGNTTCVVTEEDRVLCWGDGGMGQRGDGVLDRTRSSPVPILTGVAQVAVGATHSCALLFTGVVLCWGDGAHGALGRVATQLCDGKSCEVRPAEVPLTRVVRVRAGFGQTCAIRDDATVWCWGRNDAGQLGDGTTVERVTPAPVLGLKAQDVRLGLNHACALRDGAVHCWGSNRRATLGYGTAPTGEGCARVDFEPQYATSPHAVEGLGRATALTVGATHSCARVEDGRVACWGRNLRGELGDGHATSTGEWCSEKPKWALGLANVDVVAGGNAFTCAVAAGLPYCWGMNMFGQLGEGTVVDRFIPSRVAW